MDLKSVYSKVFYWMFLGLLVTFLTGYTVANNTNMSMFIFEGMIWVILAIIEIVLVLILSARLHKMNPITAKIMFMVYSVVTGLTFSSIFIVYEIASIIYVFAITAAVFGIFAALGHFTKLDLSKISTFLLMGLIGVVICSIVNMFLGNNTFDLVISIISIIVFLGLTAYDMQKIKNSIEYYPNIENLAIYGALELYLDFINIFLDLLKLIGKSRD